MNSRLNELRQKRDLLEEQVKKWREQLAEAEVWLKSLEKFISDIEALEGGHKKDPNMPPLYPEIKIPPYVM